MSELNGVLPVDKPEGPTSHDVVAIARRAIGLRRIGHTGTLDPFASGLLLLCLGPATRLSEYLTALPKAYTATIRLGTATGSQTTTFTIPKYLLHGTRTLRFLADPIGSSRTPVSDEITVQPGDQVTLQIPPS